jgi:uncharacterized heparinase superfamily protein
MSQAAHLMNRMRNRLQSLAYANSLYQLFISGPVPKILTTIPTDAWPGDAKAGQAIINGHFAYAGQRFSCQPASDVATWLPQGANRNWRSMVQGFGWLRDLRATGGDNARRMARTLMTSWLDHFAHWAVEAWDPPVMADRITHIIGMHDFFLASADSDFRDRVFESMVRQIRHLLRITPGSLSAILAPDPQQPTTGAGANAAALFSVGALQGYDLIRVVRGLVFAGVALPDGDKPLGFALSVLPAVLRHAMTPDGLVRERSGFVQARVTKCLIDIRHALKASGFAVPPELQLAIDKACASLRLLRYGDGALGVFHGGQEDNPLFIDAIFTQADHRGRAPKSLAHGGYERLAAGRMLVLVDAGAPPLQGLDGAAHAGLSSFELAVGRERLFVNCGAHPGGEADAWYQALAATAAHSALGVDNKNSSEILPEGGLGRRAAIGKVSRFIEGGRQHLEVSHDGYRPLHVTHQRILILGDDGDELTGEDQLQGPEGLDYALRFHLHPLVQASLIQNDRAVLLRLPSGAGYRLSLEDGIFSLEESVYYGQLNPRKTVQIVHRGRTRAGATLALWALHREGRKG